MSACTCNRFIVINISRKPGERTENFRANSREIRSNPRQFGKLCVPNTELSARQQMLAAHDIQLNIIFFFFLGGVNFFKSHV